MTPPSTDVGFTQLVMTSPSAMPGGTLPEATPPTTAPRKHGVTRDDRAKAAPGGSHVPVCDPGGTPPGGDGAHDGPQEVRGDQGRQGERGAEEAPHRQGRDALAEGESRPAPDHPERRQRQGEIERGHDGGERAGERRPQDDQYEDQPDVVGLPHRADGVLDQVPLPCAPAGASGEQVPDSRAEVGTAEETRSEEHTAE